MRNLLPLIPVLPVSRINNMSVSRSISRLDTRLEERGGKRERWIEKDKERERERKNAAKILVEIFKSLLLYTVVRKCTRVRNGFGIKGNRDTQLRVDRAWNQRGILWSRTSQESCMRCNFVSSVTSLSDTDYKSFWSILGDRESLRAYTCTCQPPVIYGVIKLRCGVRCSP